MVPRALGRVVLELARALRDGDPTLEVNPSSEAPEVSRANVKSALAFIAREALDHGEPDELGGWSLIFSQATSAEDDARELANCRATRLRATRLRPPR
jgi:hypothetical protein